MSATKDNINAHWENFNKYIGIQGIMSVILVCAFTFASLKQIPLPDLFTQLMTLIIGFYFAKNGVGIVAAIQANKLPQG